MDMEFPEESLESKLLKAQELLAEEKTLKLILKQTVPSFIAKPKPLLKPWMMPKPSICSAKMVCSTQCGDVQAAWKHAGAIQPKLTALCDKYADTYQHISQRKQESAATWHKWWTNSPAVSLTCRVLLHGRQFWKAKGTRWISNKSHVCGFKGFTEVWQEKVLGEFVKSLDAGVSVNSRRYIARFRWVFLF